MLLLRHALYGQMRAKDREIKARDERVAALGSSLRGRRPVVHSVLCSRVAATGHGRGHWRQ